MEAKLSSLHLEDLHSSGLTDETIENLGFYSGTSSDVEKILGFNVGPGLIIPYPRFDDSPPFFRVKPDDPPVIDGKPAKYLSPKSAIVRAYIPPKTWELLKDPKTAVIITEGEKKAAKADQEGFPCIGLGGIWGFSQKHRLIPDLSNIEWEDRAVFLAPDSDHCHNLDVKLAVFTLERWLIKLGASVLVVRIPVTKDAAKAGIDDFLVGKSPDALKQLLNEAKPALYWEIEDIADLPENKRLKPLRSLFIKLADMEPIEISLWKKLCDKKLNIAAADFKAQLKLAKQEKQRKQVSVEGLGNVEEAEETQIELERESAELTPKALDLLNDPALLYRVGQVVHRFGVAGEGENILLLYLVITSRILNAPLSATLKGESSSGKSYITEKVCRLFTKNAYIPMTGMTRQALVYSKESYSHRTIIIFERTGMEAADYNIRTLQSEGKIIFETVLKDPKTNRYYTECIEREGPTNFIFTTTEPGLHPENETRHWTLLMDESPELTSSAKLETAKRYEGRVEFPEEDLWVWRHLQNMLKPVAIHIPYAQWLANHTPAQPLRMRRDFNKLLTLIEVIALLHQYQRRRQDDMIIAGIEDYFMAKELISQVFAASLTGIGKKVEALVSELQRLHKEKLDNGELHPAVKPIEIARALYTSSSSASRWLRPAIEAGLVEVESETQKGRIKLVKPGDVDKRVSGNLPTVEELADAFPELAVGFKAVHPVTGEEITLEDTEIALKAEKNHECRL
jgi:hypothetical protein